MYTNALIKWIKKETRDTSTYAFKVKDKIAFIPGQFNMLYVPGIGEAPISISSLPGEHELLHTIRIAGDVTTAISRLSTGESILLRGPYGKGWPLEELKEKTLLVIAGGLGIAPLRSVLRYASRQKHDLTGRPVLLYGSKTPKDIIFRDEFPRFREAFDVFLTVDKADPEMIWRGETGLVTEVIHKINIEPLHTVVFLCGPEIMMKNMIPILIQTGISAENIYLSMERNMNCGMGICGHCMFGPFFVCKDGPVFRYSEIMNFLDQKEL